jgi:tripartite-type tricarboxylate transporter receptor subunit TctC
MAPYWQEALPGNSEITVEHITGGGGLAATQAAYQAEPNGYTLLHMYPSQIVIGELFMDVNFDGSAFEHIGIISQDPFSIAVRSDLEIEGWEDFVNRIDEFTFATQGVATNGHLDPIVIGELTGAYGPEQTDFVHYEGSGPAAQALASGEANVHGASAGSTFDIAQSFEEIEQLFVFADSDAGQPYANQARYFINDISANDISEVVAPTTFARFFTAPPETPESITRTLVNTFSELIDNRELLNELAGSTPAIKPTAGPEEVIDIMESQRNIYQSEPLNSLITRVLG